MTLSAREILKLMVDKANLRGSAAPFTPELEMANELLREPCTHTWQEQPGEPPIDVCSDCGEVRR